MTLLKVMLDRLKLPGESLSDFRAGIAEPTPKDKDDLRAWFAAEGVVTDA